MLNALVLTVTLIFPLNHHFKMEIFLVKKLQICGKVENLILIWLVNEKEFHLF